MPLRRSSLVPALIVTWVAASAHAQKALTLSEALDLARARNHDLKASRARLDQSQVQIRQALAALIPTVAAQGKYTHNYKEVTLDLAAQAQGFIGLANLLQATGNNPPQAAALEEYKRQITAATAGQGPIVIQPSEQLDFALSATVPLVVPGAYPAVTAAKRSYEAAGANNKVTETAVLLGTAQAFYGAAGTDELVLARRHGIEVAKQTLDNAKARLEAGVVNRVEVTRAELALVRAEQTLREALDVQAQAYRSVRTLIQLDEPFRVEPGPESQEAIPTLEQLEQDALRLRPEFLSYEKNRAAVDAQVSSARWRWAPTLSGFGLFRGFNYKGFIGDNYSWALGLQLDWLVYDGGIRDAQAKLAQAQGREVLARQALLKDSVADEVANARRALETRRRALEAALRSVDLSRETLELVRVQHDAGTATQLDLLQAQDALVGSEVAVAQTRFDLALSGLQLKRAAGLFPSP